MNVAPDGEAVTIGIHLANDGAELPPRALSQAWDAEGEIWVLGEEKMCIVTNNQYNQTLLREKKLLHTRPIDATHFYYPYINSKGLDNLRWHNLLE